MGQVVVDPSREKKRKLMVLSPFLEASIETIASVSILASTP